MLSSGSEVAGLVSHSPPMLALASSEQEIGSSSSSGLALRSSGKL